MLGNGGRSATISVAVAGGLVGVATVWLSRPDPAPCTTLDNGMRACMPVLVEGPPWWLYGVAAVLGALLAGGGAVGFALARRRRRR